MIELISLGYPGIFGSSVMHARYLLSLSLKQFTEHSVTLRMCAGRLLNSLGPLICRLPARIDFIAGDICCLVMGILHSRPWRLDL